MKLMKHMAKMTKITTLTLTLGNTSRKKMFSFGHCTRKTGVSIKFVFQVSGGSSFEIVFRKAQDGGPGSEDDQFCGAFRFL